jgi:hypothetical protein
MAGRSVVDGQSDRVHDEVIDPISNHASCRGARRKPGGATNAAAC